MQSNSAVNVLLVDDEPANLLALEVVLEPLGANLVRAVSGEDALRKAQDADFAAILMDVRMPGMDGFEAAKLIRSRPRSRATPIIFVTADGSELSAEEAYSMGAVDFLTKPLIPVIIKAKVAFFIELQRGKDELRAAGRRASQERAFLAAVLEAIEDGVVACDADGKLTLFNRATRSFHGLPQDALPPEQWAAHYSLFREDGSLLPTSEIPLARALAGEHVSDLRMVIAPHGGNPRTVVASGRPLYDDDGQKLGAVVSMHDVTAVREAELAREAAVREQGRREEAEAAAELINASKERVRLATEAGGLGVWLWETETDTVVWEHDWLYDMFGLPRDAEPLNAARFVSEFLHPDDRDAFMAAAAATMERGEPFQFVGRFFRHPDHEVRWLEFRGRRQIATDGVLQRVLGTAADITERHRFQERLRVSEERYRALFEAIDEGFCLIDVIFDAQRRPIDYRFLEINPAFAHQTGLQDPVGKRVTELVPGHESKWFDVYGQVVLTGQPVRFIDEAQAMGRWFDVYAARLGGADSSTVAVLFTDITARKQADDDLRRLAAELAESDRRKTEFLATLAHELRNPLAPLSSGLQVMRLSASDPVAIERTRSMMERQINHMVHLVDDLLDIARISTGKVELKKERVDLQTVIASAVETSLPLIEAGRHELHVQMPDEELMLDVDLTRVAQVVSNLLNNAAKYTPARGRIGLSAHREGDFVVIAVADTGIGIPPSSMPTVFEMFTQVGRNMERAQGGLGIGLSLVRRLVELHGGTVQASSEGVGRGSTFTVRLPLAPDTPAAAPGPAPSRQPVAAPTAAPPAAPAFAVAAPAPALAPDDAEGGLRVLVVDDNTDAADTLGALLDMSGHATRIANDGYQAIEVAQAFQPQVVFLDIGLPGMNGYEVARKLRELPGMDRAFLVALTGWGAREDRERSSEAGFDHHLTKPADMGAVETLLSNLARVD
ncbi:response regulator [Caenimonas terrae]|uniref:histidine kinase n=1 Tax=Caenimonas terrae TaxID=696074 RepID=A0ABW0NCB5_9BURK